MAPKFGKGAPGPKQDLSAHTPGIKQGNSRGNYDKQSGHLPDGRSNARRSTGINPELEDPIDPSMPNLSPG
ncbi:MAG TPA: hypothetical protein VH300_03540 [Thermoleophilaceae bacterium]|jgi:hypothetical protein|nr:hypothetical protein [Thermoleophilaceae bacterium]